MKPQQKTKWLILERLRKWGMELPVITADNVDALYDAADDIDDARAEIRGCGVATGLPSRRHFRDFEDMEVAAQCPDGSWVGWTYYYGGGKHANPSALDWLEYAYDVAMTEEMRVVQVFRVLP